MRISQIVLFIILIISCQKEDVQLTNCLGDPYDLLFESCEFENLTNDQICNYQYKGSYTLYEDSYQYLPQYCLDENSIIEFSNSNGEHIKFKLSNKRFYKSKTGSNTFEPCENDSLKTKGICIDNEVISIYLTAISQNLKLSIAIRTLPDTHDLQNEGVGDFLVVNNGDISGIQTNDFRCVINQRTLSYDKTHNQEFYEKLELNTTQYNNVTSNDISVYSNPKIKYYFNKDKGLIGFEDTNKVIWTIND